jgi:hypothetical protein
VVACRALGQHTHYCPDCEYTWDTDVASATGESSAYREVADAVSEDLKADDAIAAAIEQNRAPARHC